MKMMKSNTPDAETLPHIDLVIIGVNCQKTLARCLTSIQAADYSGTRLHTFYVDGGSIDKSIEIAGQFDRVEVIPLNPEYPTPGMGRNRGWERGRSPLVQFMDSDTILDPGWLKKGITAMADPATGAVQGIRQEMHPEKSIFNWIGDLEWNGPAGEADSFGGDVIIRRLALEATGGYDEMLVGGEDPELSRRIIRRGWRILQLSAPMTRHDLAMTRISHYLKRAYRSGYGFAAVQDREARQNSIFWRHEIHKIIIRGGGFILLGLVGSFLAMAGSKGLAGTGYFCIAAGAAALFRPRLLKVKKFMNLHNLSRKQARRYAWHCSLVVLPQFYGVVRYHWGKWLNQPLRNHSRVLSTDKTEE